MTIELLLGQSAIELEQFKGPELTKYFGHFLPITRPEQAARQAKKPSAMQMTFLSPEEQQKKAKVKDILLDLGLDPDDFND